MDLSIIIPVYNEEKVIESTLVDIVDFLKSLHFEYEIIVVDDGSLDNTKKIVNSLNIDNLTLLEHSKNMGKGLAVKDGVLFSKGDYILFMDADSSTTINHLTSLITSLKSNNAHIAIASREHNESIIKTRQSTYKEAFGRFGNLFMNYILKLDLKDTQCGFKLFKKEVKEIFKKQTLNGFSFDMELLYLAKKLNYKVIEVPITWSNNIHSSVKLKDYFKTILDIFKIKFKNYG
ncbi:glycosyltransferase family 2 protein [bacterium]|jgi:dolichyl-phosphate beta-glucosyltransferase|nr:glycosyltransferase family 2 protein [bacterium]MBT4122068.1 glycosyltransferase family 2 protein [bacterium]MBT4334972.1 glycosyltransferase family 2 protein [bacterium]MBT4496011.1 glycosyltransferase family 2 protein [bacterium]MBT4764040.1 glycosyltransferase family 2 protein [bacterium]